MSITFAMVGRSFHVPASCCLLTCSLIQDVFQMMVTTIGVTHFLYVIGRAGRHRATWTSLIHRDTGDKIHFLMKRRVDVTAMMT